VTDEPPAESTPSEEPRWRFDPANPPEVWTREMVGQLTLGQIEELANPENGLLPEASQASFDEAHRQLNEDLAAKLKPAIDKMMPKVVSPALSDTLAKLQNAAAASIKVPKFEMPALENLRRLEAQQAQHRADIETLSDSIAEGQRRKEDRADAQARATIEIAQAQQKLHELQEEALDLARRQADATAEVGRAQQGVLEAVTEELAVLKEQSQGQRKLIRSSWASGVVMEWTLFVAVIAAVATIVLGTAGTESISTPIWVGASAVGGLLAISLLIWQFRRRPPKPTA
jgi:hypothetical protein